MTGVQTCALPISYADLRKKLLEEYKEDSEAIEGDVDGEEAGEEEKGILEIFQDGVNKLWDNVSQWFLDLRGK